MYGSSLNYYTDLWDKETEERRNLSRNEQYKYFVNAIDLAQNNKQCVLLVCIYSLLIPMCS